MFPRLNRRISHVFPRKLHEKVRGLLVQGGLDYLSEKSYLGFVLFFSLCISASAFFLARYFYPPRVLYHAVALVAGFVASIVFLYFILSSRAESRARKIEELLPDALKLISANIRAGMTLENAVWSAARPEFGALRDEIKKVSADSFGGKPLSQTLQKMSERVRSRVLDRAVKLINEGIRLGGEMAKLLDEVADDIRESQLMQKEIATSTMTYSLFIIFAALIASPMLFAVSTYYSEMSETILLKQTGGNGAGPISEAAMQKARVQGLPGMQFGGVREQGVTSKEVFYFAITCISITTFFSALTLSKISKGKALAGLRQAPFFVLVGLTIFFSVHWLLQNVFKLTVQ